jgi:hypothetical protein
MTVSLLNYSHCIPKFVAALRSQNGVAGIYQRHRYAKEVREAFELWSQHIEALITKKAVAA